MPQPEKAAVVKEEAIAEAEAEVQKAVAKVELVKKSIKVMATRAGYYQKSRKVQGDVFTVEGEHQLGSWMKRI